jgi:amidase
MAKHPIRMSRRTALKSSTIASAGLLLPGVAHAAPAPASRPAFAYQEGTVKIEAVSAADLAASLAAGEISSRELVQACLDRIAAFDHAGPNLNAMIELNPNALALADERDAERAAGTIRGPLHGLPVVIKDNIATADGMENTAGSLALVGAKPVKDAFIVAKLLEAGAIIVGKTNLSEWANIRSFTSTSGWSGRGGQTRNPHVIDRTPSGSSSGTGAAVAASYVPFGIGTETNGSIVSPAGNCGVVGLKPTVGLVSRSGIIPISASQDSAGPIARNVADAALLLSAIAGDDPDDPAQATVSSATPVADAVGPSYPFRPAGSRTPIDYVAQLSPDALAGARIGVARSQTGFHPAADAIFEAALEVLKGAGADLVDPLEIPGADEVLNSPDSLELLLWELKAGIADYLAVYTAPDVPIRTLDDVVRYNNDHADLELQYFDQSLFDLAVGKTGLDDEAYRTAAATLQQGARGAIDGVIAEHRLDAILALTNGPATKIDLVTGDHWLGGSSTLSAIAGYPILTVPAGAHFDLPVGISFYGSAWSEARLLQLGHAFELAANVRIVPQYIPGSVIPAGPETTISPDASPVATPVG